MVILSPEDLKEPEIKAYHAPDLFVPENGGFISASAETLPGDAVAIFDVSAITDKPTTYTIPLTAEHAGFHQQRYWRVPVKQEVMLMMIIERMTYVTETSCEEIEQARIIYSLLLLHKCRIDDIGPSAGKKRVLKKDKDEPLQKQPHPSKKSKYELRARGTTQKTMTSRPGPLPPKKRRLKI